MSSEIAQYKLEAEQLDITDHKEVREYVRARQQEERIRLENEKIRMAELNAKIASEEKINLEKLEAEKLELAAKCKIRS